jgi:hypothetical protein
VRPSPQISASRSSNRKLRRCGRARPQREEAAEAYPTNLYKERPAWLANPHTELNATVAAACGFDTDLTNEQIVEKLLALKLDWAAAEKEQSAEPKRRASRAKLDEELV